MPLLPFFSNLATGGEPRGNPSLRWPTPSDLNTRLRRIIAGYQRVVKKAELKKAAAEKVNCPTFTKTAIPSNFFVTSGAVFLLFSTLIVLDKIKSLQSSP